MLLEYWLRLESYSVCSFVIQNVAVHYVNGTVGQEIVIMP
jgi:hypothetical protein